MMRSLLVALSILFSANAATAATADTNVALNGGVSTFGSGIGNSDGWGEAEFASLASVTDNIFVSNGQQWNTGTVFWSGSSGGDASNYLTISLAQTALVNRIVLQADNNDLYTISYRANVSKPWQDLVTIDPDTASGGMATGTATFFPVLASAFKIRTTGGDGWYSVSEFQAMGTVPAVPEPESYAMLMMGLGLVSLIARRRNQAA